MLCSDLCRTVTVTAGFNEEGEMRVVMFGFGNNLQQSFDLQDGDLMDGRLSFENANSRYTVTFGLDEAGRLEMMVTVEVPAPSEKSLQELRRKLGWLVPNLQETSGQNLMVSYTKKFKRIE